MYIKSIVVSLHCKQKQIDMNIDKANLTELQNEALFNDELYNFIEKKRGNAEKFIESQSLEDLRNFIGNWVINNSEC